jgi:hypothetical protein
VDVESFFWKKIIQLRFKTSLMSQSDEIVIFKKMNFYNITSIQVLLALVSPVKFFSNHLRRCCKISISATKNCLSLKPNEDLIKFAHIMNRLGGIFIICFGFAEHTRSLKTSKAVNKVKWRGEKLEEFSRGSLFFVFWKTQTKKFSCSLKSRKHEAHSSRKKKKAS